MNKQDILSTKSKIEALLFAWADPLDIQEISTYFDLRIDEVREIMKVLQYEYENRGIRLQIMGNLVQLNTHPDFSQIIERFGYQQRKKSLSSAAMECLSIIAYLQPTTKVVLEQIRGVKSDGPVQTLLERGLIKEMGKLKQPGRPYVYKTTDLFLKSFELEHLKDLPELKDRDTIKEILKFTEINPDDIEPIVSDENEVGEMDQCEDNVDSEQDPSAVIVGD